MEAGLRMHDGRVIKGMTIPRQLILVIAISATILGSALGKSPKPSTGGQSPSNQTIRLAAPDRCGTDQLPLMVKVLPAQKSQSETEKEERDQKAKAEVDAKSAFETQRIADYTWWLAAFTLTLFCIAIVQAGLFVWQLLLIRESLADAKIAADAAKDGAKAARDSVDIAKLSMIAGDRAYVHFNGCRWISHRQNGESPVFWRLRPCWINSGNTPTRNLLLYVHYELLDEPIQADYQFIRSTNERRPAMIAPKGLIESLPRDFLGEDLVAVKEGRKYLYVWGSAMYRDVFPNTIEHVTKFCVVATNISGNPLEPWDEKTNIFDIAFVTFDRHNCADEECNEAN
jgi:hypothetical protein